MVKPEIIGLLAVALLFLLTVPFFSTQAISVSSGSGSDSNQVKVSVNDAVSDYLFSKLQAGTGIALSIQNPGGDENILISATGSTDTNCSISGSCPSIVYQNGDANISDLNVNDSAFFDKNVTVNQNILAFDANSNIGTNAIPFGTLFLLNLFCRASSGGICMTLSANTWPFATSVGSGLFFSGSPQSFQYLVSNDLKFSHYVGATNDGLFFIKPRETDGTIASGIRAGTFQVKTYSDHNALQIYDGNSWSDVGSRLSQLQVDGSANVDGDFTTGANASIGGGLQVGGGIDTNNVNSVNGSFSGDVNMGMNVGIVGTLTVDGNILGEVFGVQVAVGTSCTSGCSAFNGTPTGSTWVCLKATTLAAVASTCGDTLVPKNCMCQN